MKYILLLIACCFYAASLIANPHSAKSETLLQELDMRIDPMPEFMKDEILEGVFVLSAKELMEAKRDVDMQFYNYGFNRLLSASLTDTIPVPVDTLLALLAADGSARSLMQQAWVMLENGDTLSAANRMASIPTEVSFSETEAKEHTEQQAFMQWLVQHPEISEEQFEDLSNFVESPSTQVSASALSLMVAHQLFDYQEPYLVPDLTKSMEVKKPKAQTSEISNGTIRIYPNPGKDYIIIEYAVYEFNGSLYYQLTDQSGKVVKTSNLGKRADQIIIDTRELSSGSYYIKLVSGNKNVAGSRFMIAK
ncbi:MAG: T9SS type A sorting domain-containing protein [Lentimicrobium sp.]|nr:T9SS type A sorting domain-containing protein [Lentimicrobium sp.]